MILDHIRLENFGAYEGIQEALLTPEEGKPVILFGGMNGGGKTTLLDAMQLALYGSKAKVSNRGRMGYKDYLQDCIHRSADPGEGAAITLRFRRTVDGVSSHFELHRSWRLGVKSIEETLRVLRDGEYDDIFTEHWDEVIEAYLPVGISNLFFFDGEQIKDLAEGGNAAAILGTAISSLLGLDLVDRLDADLRVFERRKKSEGLDPEARRMLEQAQAELEHFDKEQERLAMEQGGLVNEAGRLGKDLREKEKAFQEQGGELFLVRKRLEAEMAQLRSKKSEAEGRLRELAAGPLPLILVDSLLAEVEKQAELEKEIRQNQLLVEAMGERDEFIIEMLRDDKLGASTIKRVEKELKMDRDYRLANAEGTIILDADARLSAHISHLRSRILPQARESSREIMRNIRDLEEKIARLEAELGRVPDEDRIAQAQKDLEEARKAHAGKIAALDAVKVRAEVVARQRAEAEARLDRFGDKEIDARVSEDDRQRMLHHSKRVRETLAKFRTRVIRKHVTNMEVLMLDAFRTLLRKSDLIHGLTIDPETFVVTLTGRNNQILPFDRLSAGERQLLATALLWGLARASGRPVPTVIDTPLGRLDSSHRRHLVERYFPMASHQVLLLSTDEEIVGASHRSLAPFVARHYLLAHDEALGHTHIEPGYFPNLLSANSHDS
jgi:DNA sulfur modification protein DndD